MFARKLLTGVVAGGVAASVIGLTAGTASAAYQPDADDVVPASAADLVGVGSDTSQVVIKNAINAYNATSPAVRLGTYAATGGASRTWAGDNDGRQEGDPAKAAAAILTIADLPEMPARIPLGTSTLTDIRTKLEAVAADLDTWQDLTRSTDF